ncbi:MAG: armadillo-type protein [Benjaminiella poitrasii]|nr:MAG: armadillo-type protein [Benjaminiella poitrasii]
MGDLNIKLNLHSDEQAAIMPVIVVHSKENSGTTEQEEKRSDDTLLLLTYKEEQETKNYLFDDDNNDDISSQQELSLYSINNDRVFDMDYDENKIQEHIPIPVEVTDQDFISKETVAEQKTTNDDVLLTMTLSPLEKLIRFSKSALPLQRLVLMKEISEILYDISLQEAVEIALPIIIQISKDEEEAIKEKLAEELGKIMLFYYENAPPLLVEPETAMTTEKADDSNEIETEQFHIPKHTFAVMIIEFLLDQNTALASYAQQSVVTIAAELLLLASKNTAKHAFYHDLLQTEIYEGIVLGLIGIFDNDKKMMDEDTESVSESSGSITTSFGSGDMISHTLNPNSGHPDQLSMMISSVTNSILKNYDHGGVNLAKMVCLMLISALTPFFGSEGCTKNFLPVVESMIADPMFYVRKEAATALGSLVTAVTLDITLEKLLPLYLKLSVDTIWHVRRSCIFALPLICNVLPADRKRELTIESVERFKNDVSRNVRNSLADIMGELISKFITSDGSVTLPEELLNHFISLCGNTAATTIGKMVDSERIHNCAYNFPAVVFTAGISYWDSHLKEVYLQLTRDYQLKVRRTFAYSLHEIALVIGPERTERDLVQIFALYLMDLDDVKQGVLEHLAEFLAVLSVSSRNEYIPILGEVWDGVLNNWHLRDILTQQLREIARLFDAARVVDHILPLALKACHDEYAAIRETGVEIFPVILDILKKTLDESEDNPSQIEEDIDGEELDEEGHAYALSLLAHVMKKIDKLVTSSAYRVRLVFAQMCRCLLTAGITPVDFASFFLSRLAVLSRDPVVNVRIAVSRAIQVLIKIPGYRQKFEAIEHANEEESTKEANPRDILDEIFYNLATDKDHDVRFFIMSVISEEDLSKYQNRKEQVEHSESIVVDCQNENDEAASNVVASLPTPPLVPIISHTSSFSDIPSPDEECSNRMAVDGDEEEHEKESTSTDSPMDISIDEHEMIIEKEKGTDKGTTEPSTEMIIQDEDLIMKDGHEDVAIKAQHIYLSKSPVQVLKNDEFASATTTDKTIIHKDE